MLAERRNSPSSGRPSTSRRTVWVRFPCATAAMARVTSVVGRSRSSTSVLTETSISPQAPRDSMKARALACLAFLADDLPDALQFLRHLLIGGDNFVERVRDLSGSPVHEPGRRTEKSPSRMVCRLASMTARSGESGSATSVECPLLFFGAGSEFTRAVAERSLRFTVTPDVDGISCFASLNLVRTLFGHFLVVNRPRPCWKRIRVISVTHY